MRVVLFVLYLTVGLSLSLHSIAQPNSSNSVKKVPLEEPKLTIFSDEYDDWTYQCISPDGIENTNRDSLGSKCEITQVVRKLSKNGFIQLINVSLAPAIDKTGLYKWALLISAPLNLDVNLPSKLSLSINNKNVAQTRFRNCNAQGCQAVIPVNSSLLKEFKRANLGRFQLKIRDARVVKFEFSLIGFTKAFNAISFGQLPENLENSVNDKAHEIKKFEIITQSHGDWMYRCLMPADGTDRKMNQPASRCEITHTVQKDINGKDTDIIKISLAQDVGKTGNVKWTMAMWLPLGLNIHLPSEIALFVGENKPFVSQFKRCNAEGCKVIITVGNSLLKHLKQSEGGVVRFRLLDGKVVDTKFSLKGFLKAFNSLSSDELPKK